MFDIHVIHPAGPLWLLPIPIAINLIQGGAFGILAGETARRLRGRQGRYAAWVLNFLIGGAGWNVSAFFNVGQFPITPIVSILLASLPSFLLGLLHPGHVPAVGHSAARRP